MEKTWLELGKFDRMRINEYNGKFSLQMGSQGKEKVYITWINPLCWDNEARGSIPAKKQDGSPLLVPLQIPLGEDMVSAGNTLKALYTQLTEDEEGRETEKPKPDTRKYNGPPTKADKDVPF